MNIQTRFGGGIAGSKAMFELLMDISVGPPRLPLHGLTDEVKAQMKYALQAEGFISIWNYRIITSQLFITLLLGSKDEIMLTEEPSCIQTNMYRLYKKNAHKWSLFYIIYTSLFGYNSF